MFTLDAKRVPHGIGVFIWQLDQAGGPTAVIKKCQQAGLDGVFLKGADGGSIWGQQFNAGVVQQFRNAGLSVIGWQYIRGDNTASAWWTSIAGEIAAAKYMLECGALSYCFDDETDIDNRPYVAIQECQAIRAAFPAASIGYNPYPYPSSDRRQPFFEFNEYCDWCAPQLYVGQDGLGTPASAEARMATDFAKWSAVWAARSGGRPAIPLGIDWQAASWPGAVQPDDFITQAAQVSKQKGYPFVTYWDLDALTPGEWGAMGQASAIWHGGTPPTGGNVAITIERNAQNEITGARDDKLGTHVGAGIAKAIDAGGWTSADLAVGEMFGMSEGVTGAVLRGSTKQVITWSAANGATVYANDIADLVQDLQTALQAAKSNQHPPIDVAAILADAKALIANAQAQVTTATDIVAKLPAAA